MRPHAHKLIREARVQAASALLAEGKPGNREIQARAILAALDCLVKAWAASGLDYPDDYDRRRAG